EVDFKTVVGDRKPDLVSAARIAFSRADIIIFMGGLGPTEDDLTRQAVAEALGLELKRDPEIGAALFAFFASRKVKMPENNLRQPDVIARAEALKNPRGTTLGRLLDCQ